MMAMAAQVAVAAAAPASSKGPRTAYRTRYARSVPVTKELHKLRGCGNQPVHDDMPDLQPKQKPDVVHAVYAVALYALGELRGGAVGNAGAGAVGVDAVLAAVEVEMRVALTAAGADAGPIDIEQALAVALAATRVRLGGGGIGRPGGVRGAAAFDEAAVPLSGFSLASKAEMEAEKAKGGGKDFAVLAASKKNLEASRILDINAHKEQLGCAARMAELDAQFPDAFAAAEAAEDYARCDALNREKGDAATQLEAATDRRAKEWAAAAAEAAASAAKAAARHTGTWVRYMHYRDAVSQMYNVLSDGLVVVGSIVFVGYTRHTKTLHICTTHHTTTTHTAARIVAWQSSSLSTCNWTWGNGGGGGGT
jgi:hypothetical protein